MIPKTIIDAAQTESTSYETSPSLTYKLDLNKGRIGTKIDGKEAILQAIVKILSTSKYANVIYNWYYGNELVSLIGMPYSYIIVEAPRIVEEALLVDDRIKKIDGYEFSEISTDSMQMSFVVHTIYGTIQYTQEVRT